jgi:hypothetical protein
MSEGIIRTWLTMRDQKNKHLKFMAQHLLQCAQTIEHLRQENEELRTRGDALAFVTDQSDWSMEAREQIQLQVALWREMDDAYYE